ncbi:50S ribosomal protein L18 [Candidatus Uhrbacteria bacterium]|nr:50S ribosomal protein L18 [Candidatus Uhrbacteria bacterium]
MSKKTEKMAQNRLLRKQRVRAKVSGTAARPRLSVYRSLGHIYAQLIDDAAGKTLAASSDLEIEAKDATALKKGEGERKAKVSVAYAVGKLVAERGKKKGVEAVVFDRNGFTYHGRVAALAEGARDGGLKF